MSNKFDFFNSLNNKKELIRNLNSKSTNTFINLFIQDLQNYLSKIQTSKLLSKLEPYSLLTFAKFDGKFAICFDYEAKKIYHIPKNQIQGAMPKPGEALKVVGDGTFYVDYTAILAKEDEIDNYLAECDPFWDTQKKDQ